MVEMVRKSVRTMHYAQFCNNDKLCGFNKLIPFFETNFFLMNRVTSILHIINLYNFLYTFS
jgi:hypothetical protein